MLNHPPSQVTSKSVNLGATLDGPLIKGKFEAAMDTGTPVEAPLHDLLSAPAWLADRSRPRFLDGRRAHPRRAPRYP